MRRTDSGSSGSSAYSPARREEIRSAVMAFYKALDAPKQKNAERIAGVKYSTLAKYRSGAKCPLPVVMHRLWCYTGDSVFVVQDEEACFFASRGYEVPVFSDEGKVALPPKVVARGKGKAIYTPDRRQAIAVVIARIYDELPVPKKEKCKAILGYDPKTVWSWRNQVHEPSPQAMYSFWKKTGDDIFLLSEEERTAWQEKGETIPENFYVQEKKKAEVVTPNDDKKTHPVFTTERLTAIAMAVERYLETLPKPTVTAAEKQLGVVYRTVYGWKKCDQGGRAPRPKHLRKLFELSSDETFLLTTDERKKFESLGERFPTEERVLSAGAASLKSGLPGEITPTTLGQELKIRSASDLLQHLLIVFSSTFFAIEELVEAIPAVKETHKQKAIEMIWNLIRLFGIEFTDLVKMPKLESDPEALRRFEKIFGQSK